LDTKCSTHEEESQVEVCERCPCEEELDGIVNELDLIPEQYFIFCAVKQHKGAYLKENFAEESLA